jgi:hypothetical protein
MLKTKRTDDDVGQLLRAIAGEKRVASAPPSWRC